MVDLQGETHDGSSCGESLLSQESRSSLDETPTENHDEDGLPNHGMSKRQAYNLYTSHMLSTWNARTYDFAAIIFTASAYPNTLSASSLRGLITTSASICFSSSIGSWIDISPSRLKILNTTISANRASVILASIVWFFLVRDSAKSLPGQDVQLNMFSIALRDVLFTAVMLFDIVEKLSGSANMMSMERDWVVCLAAQPGQPYDLTGLNAVMRRIDLVCKLVAPLAISLIISGIGTKAGVIVVGSVSSISWGIEMWCAEKVWKNNARLRISKPQQALGPVEERSEMLSRPARNLRATVVYLKSSASSVQRTFVRDFKLYFSTSVWVPSMALCLLHLSALSYSAIFITYLLNVGFSLNLITAARAVGSIVEISSTVVTPIGIKHLGKAANHGGYSNHSNSEEEHTLIMTDNERLEQKIEIGLERLGLWGIIWQVLNLTPVVLVLWSLSSHNFHNPSIVLQGLGLSPTLAISIPLFTFLSLSRLGLWIFDLTTQQLTQTLVPAASRSSFAGVEYSFISIFQFGSYIMALLFSKPEEFRWLAAMSGGAVLLSTAMYAGWVRGVRGHLVHWENIAGKCGCSN